ncbi:hypothetical protein DFH29DRAFT_971826 [Suillus ampliporus]|nr:hypothetical protein DFH29DRAFT_971826 [Suillus ampliporus]
MVFTATYVMLDLTWTVPVGFTKQHFQMSPNPPQVIGYSDLFWSSTFADGWLLAWSSVLVISEGDEAGVWVVA